MKRPILLLPQSLQVNETFTDGQTALHKAILRGHKQAIELLVKRGANVNAKEQNRNMTPLHYMAIVDSPAFFGHKNWSEDERISKSSMAYFYSFLPIESNHSFISDTRIYEAAAGSWS